MFDFDYGTSYARFLIGERLLEAERGRLAKAARLATSRKRTAGPARPPCPEGTSPWPRSLASNG
jgi:hypothetical protein